MTGASPACGETWSQMNWPYVEQQVRRLQMRIAKAIQQDRSVDTGSYLWPLRGLSRVLGNSHARFLGEWWSATAATYPINIAFILLIRRIRGYLSTARKNGLNLLDAMTQVFQGTPVIPSG